MKHLKRALEDTGVPNEIAPMDDEYVQAMKNMDENHRHSQDINEMAVILESEADTITELEDVGDLLGETYKEDQVVTSVAAESINLHMKSILSRLIITPYPKTTFPSTESFRRSSSRHNLQIAKESIAETIKEAWKAIKKFISNIWEKIKNFFAKFFQNTDKLRKRAKDYKNAIMDKTAGKSLKSKTYSDSSTAHCFAVNGDVNEKTVVEIIKRHSSIVEMLPNTIGVFSEVVTSSKEVLEAAKKGAKHITGEDELSEDEETNVKETLKTRFEEIKTKCTKAVDSFKNIGFQEIVKFHSDTYKDSEWVSKGFESGVFAYGKVAMALMHVKKTENAEIPTIDFSFDIRDVKGSSHYKTPSETIPVLSSNEMTSVCDSVLELADATDALKKARDKYAEMTNAALTLADSVVALLESMHEHENPESTTVTNLIMTAVKKIKFIIPKVQSGMTKFLMWLPVYNVKAGNMALDYVKRSMAQYS